MLFSSFSNSRVVFLDLAEKLSSFFIIGEFFVIEKVGALPADPIFGTKTHRFLPAPGAESAAGSFPVLFLSMMAGDDPQIRIYPGEYLGSCLLFH